ncbi:MAG: peptidoglycan DD-metalloendopeptidase family protein [Bacteroidales bacterium]|nr:peptidoglycan DD-metalloendopeptidase family protein [Candidatus Equibacterium intestinale]
MKPRHILLLAAMLLATTAAEAQDVSRQKENLAKLKEEIEYIDNQLKSTTSQHKASMNSLLLVRKKVANRRKLVAEADESIKEYDRQISAKNQEIAELQERVDTLSKYYSQLVYNTYKNRDNKVWFMYLLSSENIGQGYRRFAYLKNLSSAMNLQAQEIKESQARLEEEKAELAKLAEESKSLKQEREKDYNSMLSEEKKSQSMVDALAKDKKKYTAAIAQKRKQVEQLNKEIERILKKQVTAKEQIDYTVSGKFEQNKGRLPWPVVGVVTETFGEQTHPVYKNIKLPASNGITITTTSKSKVRCVFDGVVKQILIMPGYNKCVLVQHGEYFTFYCKLDNTSVKAGQKIAAGDTIGTLEQGEDNSSQLHFQIWKGSTKQNPQSWLK